MAWHETRFELDLRVFAAAIVPACEMHCKLHSTFLILRQDTSDMIKRTVRTQVVYLMYPMSEEHKWYKSPECQLGVGHTKEATSIEATTMEVTTMEVTHNDGAEGKTHEEIMNVRFS